jgi:hypothetical protein
VVASNVTVIVVDVLEVIDVEQAERQRRALTPRAFAFVLQQLHEIATIGGAGQ